MVVSNTSVRAAALEASLLYQDRISSRIVLANWIYDPLDDKVRGLGIPYLSATELAKAILEHAGVPPSKITVLPDRVDGTQSEVAAIVAFARNRMPASIVFITARSHTARARWLLLRGLPAGTRVTVRSSRFDDFSVRSWWLERDQSREVMSEYLRWFATLMLPRFWHGMPAKE
jgi:uncharacterized SAM-binding protein YcdF (DUF218 family)